jgi:hypothetical protein
VSASLYSFYRGPIAPIALVAWGTNARGVRRGVIFEADERYSQSGAIERLKCAVTGVVRA